MIVLACFATVIVANYNADLTTSMTVQKKAIGPKSLKELFQSELEVSVLYGTAQHSHMQQSNPNTPLGKIYETIKNMPERLISTDCNTPCQVELLQVKRVS